VGGVEAGVDSPLFSEGAFCGPGEQGGEREEHDSERQLPGRWRTLPKVGLPESGVGDADEQNSPAGAWVDSLGGTCFLIEEQKWSQPEKPSGGEDDVCENGHGSEYSSLLFPARVESFLKSFCLRLHCRA
jgi:hypothetical protein